MVLKLYNTLSRKKEVFKPIKGKNVGLYTCGITSYDYAHIGNLRTYVFEDILKRVLLFNKFRVKHVMNITDVGHLTSDADTGEDKMVKALKREGLKLDKSSMLKLADKYTKAFKQDIKKLNLKFPDIWCKATTHIKEQIDMIKKLEKKSFTYKTKVGLIFDTSKYKDYGKLGRLKLKELKAGARVSVDPERKNISDFALWITNQPKHIMQWNSPWGKGFPGWHLECSAMSTKYLGKQFDIHCGGIDNLTVHHVNEVAQSECAFGVKPWVKYWLHGEFLILKSGRMGKSVGNFVTLKNLEEEGFSALDYRYFLLGSHYRKQLMFSKKALANAKNSFNELKGIVLKSRKDKNKLDTKSYKKYLNKFTKIINNNLDMPNALTILWDVVNSKLNGKTKFELIKKFDEVFGLDLKNFKVPPKIEKIRIKRDKYRAQKKYNISDKMRNDTKKEGWLIYDSSEGSGCKPF